MLNGESFTLFCAQREQYALKKSHTTVVTEESTVKIGIQQSVLSKRPFINLYLRDCFSRTNVLVVFKAIDVFWLFLLQTMSILFRRDLSKDNLVQFKLFVLY